MAGRPIPNSLKKQMQKATVKHTDMPNDMKTEVVDIIAGSIDKFTLPTGVNFEGATRAIKDALDKSYGFNWHCAMGKGFCFDVTAQNGTLMHCYYQGELAILVYKCCRGIRATEGGVQICSMQPIENIGRRLVKQKVGEAASLSLRKRQGQRMLSRVECLLVSSDRMRSVDAGKEHRRPGDAVALAMPEMPEASSSLQAPTSERRLTDSTPEKMLPAPPKAQPDRSGQSARLTSLTRRSEGDPRPAPPPKSSGARAKKAPARPKAEGVARAFAKSSSSSSKPLAGSSRTSQQGSRAVASHSKAEVRDLTPRSDVPSWPQTPGSSVSSPHAEGSFCWRDMAAGLGTLHAGPADHAEAQDMLEAPGQQTALAVPDSHRPEDDMDDELDKSRRLDRMRKQLEEQQRQLEERARQLLQGQRLHQDDLQELETYQKQQLQQFDEQQEQMQRGSELSSEDLVSLELPATSLPVISEHPEYHHEISLLDEMQQQQMQELQRLQQQWQHEQEQLQQKLQETLWLPEERRCEKPLQDDEESTLELPAETCLQLAPPLRQDQNEPEPAQLSQEPEPEKQRHQRADAPAETLPHAEAMAEANADGEVFTEQETDTVERVRPGLEHLDAALAALQKSYRSSHHSAYEQHTSFLDKISQFDQRCLALVTPTELSSMPQTSSAGASTEQGGLSSDVLQLGSLVEKLTDFIGMSSKPTDKEAPVSPSPQERVTLSGGRRWPPGPQVRPGPPAPGPESAE
ncbi:DNAL4 [Symbiodinium sp. KB8]|nr:DNAL4 [Symbiodinium sp. KB8]